MASTSSRGCCLATCSFTRKTTRSFISYLVVVSPISNLSTSMPFIMITVQVLSVFQCWISQRGARPLSLCQIGFMLFSPVPPCGGLGATQTTHMSQEFLLQGSIAFPVVLWSTHRSEPSRQPIRRSSYRTIWEMSTVLLTVHVPCLQTPNVLYAMLPDLNCSVCS